MAGGVQLGKVFRPNVAVVGVVPRRECPAAAAIVKSQRCGQGRIGEIRGDFAGKRCLWFRRQGENRRFWGVRLAVYGCYAGILQAVHESFRAAPSHGPYCK